MWPFGRFWKKRSDGPRLYVRTFQSGRRIIIIVSGRVGIMSDTMALFKALQRIDERLNWDTLVVDFGGISPVDNRFDTTIVALVCNVLAVARPRGAVCEVWFASSEPYQSIFDFSHIWKFAQGSIFFHKDQLLVDSTEPPTIVPAKQANS